MEKAFYLSHEDRPEPTRKFGSVDSIVLITSFGDVNGLVALFDAPCDIYRDFFSAPGGISG